MQKRMLTSAQRLIVAADGSDPTGLAEVLAGTGVVFKENVSLREAGCRSQIGKILGMGFEYFCDLKLNDIAATMKRDAKMLRDLNPMMVTVMCSAPFEALEAFKNELPDCEVLGVTVLTDFKEADCRDLFGRSIEDQVKFLVTRAVSAGLDGIVCAPREISIVRSIVDDDFTVNCPNIRQASHPVTGDDQNPDRARTIAEAFQMGATRIVMGRPVIQAANPLIAVKLIIKEITAAMA